MDVEKRKIVIAEDDMALCELLGDILKEEGYEVAIVHDGFSLLDHLKDNQDVEAVVLDLIMPEKAGLSIFDTIRSVSPASRIVIHTGHSQYRNSVFARQADAFVEKTEGAEKIISVLKELIG